MLLNANVTQLLRAFSIALIAAKFKGWVQWSVLTGLLAGCATLPPPTPATLLPRAQPPEVTLATNPTEALPALIQLERQASIARDLAQLRELWAKDSQVIDGRSTSDPADDHIWSGQAAVLDRYVLAVFPNPPPPLTLPPDLAIEIGGDQATIRNGQDRWRFVRQQGRWWISELVYSQP